MSLPLAAVVVVIVGHGALRALFNPGYAEAHRNLRIALVRQGRLKEGFVHFSEALRLAPSAQAHYNLGTSLARAGNTEGAIGHLRDALKLDPAYELAHRALNDPASSGKK